MTDSRRYELLPEPGTELSRIRALVYIRDGVPAGTLGGLVSSERNLSQTRGDTAWIYPDASATENSLVKDHASLSGEANAQGSATVAGSARLQGFSVVRDWARVYGHASLDQQVTVSGHARVYGATRLGGIVRVSGESHVALTGDGIPRRGRISDTIHIAEISLGCSELRSAVITRQKDGREEILIGCWRGTAQALRDLILTDSWPSGCDEATRREWSPILQSVASYAEALRRLWRLTDETPGSRSVDPEVAAS